MALSGLSFLDLIPEGKINQAMSIPLVQRDEYERKGSDFDEC